MAMSEKMSLRSTREKATSAPPHGQVLLRVEGLKKAFGGRDVLNGLNLELRQGEVVLLCGENGSGKTTLLNILTGNMEPDAGTIHYTADSTSRSYRFPRSWWQKLNPFDHFTPEFVTREGVGRTWQDVRLFGTQTLRDNIAVAEPGHPGENPVLSLFARHLSFRREIELNRRSDALLTHLGLAGRGASSADKISLGQTKRVAIARAIAAGAQILFLDEPLAGLDRQGISSILELLETLVHEQRGTLVIVEHIFNQLHLHGLVTTNWLLEDGVIRRVERNGGKDNSEHLVSAESQGVSIQRPMWFGLLAGDGAEVVDQPQPRGALITRIRRPGIIKIPPKPVLEIRDLVVRRGSRVIIGIDAQDNQTGFSLVVNEGETVILQAPNGWGKSTLFAALCGLIQPVAGSIKIGGATADKLSTWERIHLGLRALPSDHNVFTNLLAEDVLRLSGNTKAIKDISLFAKRTCGSLSGGERQQVALASIPPGLIGLYDEPFAALDNENVHKFHVLGTSGAPSAQLILLPSHT